MVCVCLMSKRLLPTVGPKLLKLPRGMICLSGAPKGTLHLDALRVLYRLKKQHLPARLISAERQP